MSIYLDYSASAPIAPEVVDTMIYVLQNSIGNPDSRTHEFGTSAMRIVQTARKQTADLFGVKPNEVIFTSGATESNNLAIQGLKKYAEEHNKRHIITSSIEHKSVLECVKAMEKEGFAVDYVSPDSSGRVSSADILDLIRPDTLLVALMHVNNETGMIQPVKEMGEELKKLDVFFLVDATQSAGKLVEEIQNLKYDFLSFSAHKFQGPQGIGGLIVHTPNVLSPIMFGGHQERGMRPGTTPVAQVAGLGKACELALKNYSNNAAALLQRKQLIISLFEDADIHFKLNGDPLHMMNSVLNICFEGVSSEALMIMLRDTCAISNGSACTSEEYSLSYVLKAMALDEESIEDSVRISWGADTDLNQLKQAVGSIADTVKGFQ